MQKFTAKTSRFTQPKTKHNSSKQRMGTSSWGQLYIFVTVNILIFSSFYFVILKWSCLSAYSPAAEKGIHWNGVFISEGFHWWVYAQIKLLSKVLACPKLGSHIPHSHVIKCHVNSSPRLGIHLCHHQFTVQFHIPIRCLNLRTSINETRTKIIH